MHKQWGLNKNVVYFQQQHMHAFNLYYIKVIYCSSGLNELCCHAMTLSSCGWCYFFGRCVW